MDRAVQAPKPGSLERWVTCTSVRPRLTRSSMAPSAAPSRAGSPAPRSAQVNRAARVWTQGPLPGGGQAHAVACLLQSPAQRDAGLDITTRTCREDGDLHVDPVQSVARRRARRLAQPAGARPRVYTCPWQSRNLQSGNRAICNHPIGNPLAPGWRSTAATSPPSCCSNAARRRHAKAMHRGCTDEPATPDSKELVLTALK